jgi:Ca2+-binding RTX toxin-like protein
MGNRPELSFATSGLRSRGLGESVERSLWRLLGVVLLVFTLVTQFTGLGLPRLGSFVGRSPEAATTAIESGALGNYERLPLSFVENDGQLRQDVAYYGQGFGYSFAFEQDRVLMSFAHRSASNGEGSAMPESLSTPTRERVSGVSIAFEFLNANKDVSLKARERSPGKVNYLIGDDPKAWHTDLSSYREVVYEDLWDGIDMVFLGSHGELKYQFVVHPGASVNDIALAYNGAEKVTLTRDGALQLRIGNTRMSDSAPWAYQQVGGAKVSVTSHFALSSNGHFGFGIGEYDGRRALIVDPGLSYSTFLGGENNEFANDVAVDRDGSAYVAGATFSPDFPITPGAFDTTFGGATMKPPSADAFVTKLSPSGSRIVYSTFFGGGSFDSAAAVDVDDLGNVFFAGRTDSQTDFPTTAGAFDTTFNGLRDGFVAKLDATGSNLLFSTLLGGTEDPDAGSDRVTDMVVDDAGSAYVVGQTTSPDFPVTRGAFDPSFGGRDGFVTKVNPTGSALLYSTYFGLETFISAVALDSTGSAYLAGGTFSSDFPTTDGAFETSYNGAGDAFSSKLNPTGTALTYSSFLGGATDFDHAEGIAVDATNRAYVTGRTRSADFPVTPGAYDVSPVTNGHDDTFVTRLNSSGTGLSYSTVLGGNSVDQGFDIAVQDDGGAVVTGITMSLDFPTTPGAFDRTPSEVIDVFLSALSPSGAHLTYSSFVGPPDGAVGSNGPGAIALGSKGTVYLTGIASSADFPTTAGAFDETTNGQADGFVVKLDFTPPNRPTCLGRVPTIVGTRGNDTIVGTSQADVIASGRGNDTVRALEGKDRICGGPGRDTISGGAQRDRVHGSSQADTLRGGPHRDRVIGGNGDDSIAGNSGPDRLRGRIGDDPISGGRGNDLVAGEGGKDKLSGGVGADRLLGLNSDDNLDSRDGIAGNDANDGGPGADVCKADPGDAVSNCET